MARFFIAAESIIDHQVSITGPDVKHITRVLRLQPGDVIGLSTGDGREFEAKIKELAHKEVICKIVAEKGASTEAPFQLTLYQGLPKGDKMEVIIQKCTELGVTRFVPTGCDRSVVRLDEKKAASKRVRWQRIAEEAAKQSRRRVIPEVLEPVTLDMALKRISAGILAIMPWEEEAATGIGQILKNNKSAGQEVAIFIGPEGGFSAQEAELAKAAGVFPVSLGPRILRTETAGIVAVAIVLYELGDLGGMEIG